MLRTTNGRRSRELGQYWETRCAEYLQSMLFNDRLFGYLQSFLCLFFFALGFHSLLPTFPLFLAGHRWGQCIHDATTLMGFAVRRSGDASNTAVGDLHGLHGFGNGPRAGDYGNVGEQFRLFRTVLMRRTHFGVQPLLFFHSAQGTSIDEYPNVAKARGVKKMDTSNTSRIASEVNPRHGF